ncbi:MAG: hemerythrin domain-containing protein [Candidatus Binatia bacterium]
MIRQFLGEDHSRLANLLRRAEAQLPQIDQVAYAEFRAGLLKHIAMEEKVLLPTVQKLNGGKPLPIAAKLRRDHGALAALLVPSPTKLIIAALNGILTAHNAFEEGPGGVYEISERLLGDKAGALLGRLRAVPEVKVSRYNNGPVVFDAIHGALARAGYRLEDYQKAVT